MPSTTTSKEVVTITRVDARHLLNAFENVQAELEQLEHDEDWYIMDSRDLLYSGIAILHVALGIQEESYEEFE